MKRFRFALQPLLAYRRHLENEGRSAAALRLRELDAAQAALAHLDGFFRKQVAALRGAGAAGDPERLREHSAYFEALDRRRSRQLRVVAERQADLDRSRGELLVAGRARKLIETLHDRQCEAHAAEQRRSDQHELEESNAGRRRAATVVAGHASTDRARLVVDRYPFEGSVR